MILKISFEELLAYSDFLCQLNKNDNETIIFKKSGDENTVFLYCKDINYLNIGQICKHFSCCLNLEDVYICNDTSNAEYHIVWSSKNGIFSFSATVTEVPCYFPIRGGSCESLLYILASVDALTEEVKEHKEPKIKDVKFNDPATIVFWEDDTKTVVKAQDGEKFDKEKGLAMAIIKKSQDNSSKYYEIFKKYIKD